MQQLFECAISSNITRLGHTVGMEHGIFGSEGLEIRYNPDVPAEIGPEAPEQRKAQFVCGMTTSPLGARASDVILPLRTLNQEWTYNKRRHLVFIQFCQLQKEPDLSHASVNGCLPSRVRCYVSGSVPAKSG